MIIFPSEEMKVFSDLEYCLDSHPIPTFELVGAFVVITGVG
jgi:hypothetical protein